MPAQITSSTQTSFALEKQNTAGQPDQGYQPAAKPSGAVPIPLSEQETDPKGSTPCFSATTIRLN